jgi:hypothetical protein
MYLLYGTPVRVSEHVVEKVWVFPKDRFVEYEPSDEWWCRKYGFGHEEVRPAVMRVGNDLHFHPVRWQQFCEQAELEVENFPPENDLVRFKSRVVERCAEQFDFMLTAPPCLKRPEADFELRSYSRYEAVNSLVPKNIALCTV